MRLAKCLTLLVVLCSVGVLVTAGRRGGGGRIGGSSSRRGGGSSYKPKPPTSPPRTPAPPRHDTSHSSNSNNQFLNNERVASTGGNTHYRDPFAPSAPKPPGTVNTQHNTGGASHTPSAPSYPGAPPAYNPGYTHPGSASGVNDHPPPYPGRPVNAPPTYSNNNPYPQNGNPPPPGFNTHTQSNPPPPGFNTHTQSNPPAPGFNTHPQSNPSQPGFNTHYPSNPQTGTNTYQQNNYQGQHFPQQNYPNQNNHFGSSYPHQNQFGNAPSYSPYPGHTPSFSPYPGNTNSYPAFGGGSHGGSYPHTTYQGSAYGGSPFGNGGNYNGNPYYNTNNFGYSNNPGYFGGGQYEKKSRFGGLPIPIPIPIPIPLGGFGGFGGLGSSGIGSGSSYNHGLLNTFVKNKSKAPEKNETSIFVLNNSTVTPCTTDHFVYEHLKVSVVSCTAENCTAVKLFTTTNSQSVHSAGLTVCLENKATYSHFGDNIDLAVSQMKNESFDVCRNVSSNATDAAKPNSTEVTTVASTAESTTTTEAATTVSAETPKTPANVSVCETVECHSVELCFPFIEFAEKCKTADCPFTRIGYKPCVTVKMCKSPTTPVSTFASLNTTISKIDEMNKHKSVYDFANLTLISYHRPVITFDSNCTQNSTAPGCTPPAAPASTAAAPASATPAPAALTLAPACVPGNSTAAESTSPQGSLCVSNTTVSTPPENSTDAVPTSTEAITTTS